MLAFFMTENRELDIYKNVHKGLRFLLFRVSTNIAKFDPAHDVSFNHIKGDFEALSAYLKDHGSHEDNFFHGYLQKKHPSTLANLHFQHEHSEIDWRAVEEEAQQIFASAHPPKPEQWHRFYLRFNHFVAGYLTHLHYEEVVVLPLLRECASNDELVAGIHLMFKAFTPQAIERSKKWLLLSCNLSELKEMRYVP